MVFVSFKLVDQKDYGGLRLVGFDGLGLRVVFIIFIFILLIICQFYGYFVLQQRLGNVVQFCVWEEEEMDL